MCGSVAPCGPRWCRWVWLRIQSTVVRHSVDDSQRCLVCFVLCRHQQRNVFRLTPCLACHMSAVSHSRHACCVTQQACQLCHTATHVSGVIQQTCPLCNTENDACCVSKQRLSGTNRRILDTATDENVPFMYMYIGCLYLESYYIHRGPCYIQRAPLLYIAGGFTI